MINFPSFPILRCPTNKVLPALRGPSSATFIQNKLPKIKGEDAIKEEVLVSFYIRLAEHTRSRNIFVFDNSIFSGKLLLDGKPEDDREARNSLGKGH